MKQVNFAINSIQEFSNALDSLISLPEYKDACDLVALVSLGNENFTFTEEISRIYKERGIKGKLCGFTAYGNVCNGEYLNEQSIVTFFIFSDCRVSVTLYDIDKINLKEAALDYSQKLDADADIKCVQIFLNFIQIENGEDFITNLSFKNKDIKFAGGATSRCKGDFTPMFLFHNEEIVTKGILLIAYSGKDLFVKLKVEQGWIPVGKEHQITKLTSSKRVSEIDGMSVTELYKKYFGIEDNEYFAANARSFPWLIERDGLHLARGLGYFDEDKNIVLFCDIQEGEKFFFSFGSMVRILERTALYSRKLIPLQMEAIYLSICSYRKEYFGDEEQTEINYFKEACPSVGGTAVAGEIATYGGKVRVLNCSTVILSMREGLPEQEKICCNLPPLVKLDGEIPIMDRVYSLLKNTAKEYAEMREEEKERELQKRIEIERAANLAKSAFLSSMSHEIRTPISAVLGMNEMILREETNPKILEYAENIHNAGNALLSLINEILDFSKIEAGKMEIINDKYSLSSLLNDLLVMIDVKAKDKGLTLSFIIDSEIPDELIGDMNRLRQVLINILNNAIKYTEKGSVRLNASFKKVSDKETELTFHIVDTGIGIKEEDLPKLFSPFERIEEKRNSHIEGTGLGMSITKRLLDMMGSRLEVSSVYGSGSDFFFTVKQEVSNWAPVGDFAKKAKEKNKRLRLSKKLFTAPSAKILVVDDTSMNLTVIKNLLKRTKIQVTTCLSGKESIEACKKDKFDIIFMDHRMPVMDGSEALQKIRELGDETLNKDTPIIVLTANAVSGVKETFLAQGFNDYISKPIDPNELEEIIRKWLNADKVIDSNKETNYGSLLKRATAFKENDSFFSKISEIEEIDFDSGLKFSGSRESYKELLKEFALTANDTIQLIEKLLQEGDIKNYTVKVHALKSSARLIGAKELSEKAACLESCGDKGDREQIESKNGDLIFTYKNIVLKINEAISQSSNSKLPEMSIEELKEAYRGIRECLEAFDFDTADFIRESIEKHEIPAEEKERFEKLRVRLIQVDRDGALQILN